jgi:O-acetyl-ADP-ribose deacetylase (regulator of RNase III)
VPLKIVRNDIVKVKADIIVNTANPRPVVGGGTDKAVYDAAGREELLRYRKEIGDIEPGHIAVTPALALNARYIIHTVGPVWEGGEHSELEILSDCYRNSLMRADELEAESIAFPLISTGVYGFPKDKALTTAVSVISEFLMTHDMEVYLVVFDRKSFMVSEDLMHDVDEYISDNYVTEKISEEYKTSMRRPEGRRRRRSDSAQGLMESSLMDTASILVNEAVPSYSLDSFISRKEKTFQQKLLELIDSSGKKDPEVYRKANMDRKLFSKIRSNVNYQPKKNTAIALSISLELSEEQMKDLLMRAGYAISVSSVSDQIIMYFISRRKYNINDINVVLFEHGQPILGS